MAVTFTAHNARPTERYNRVVDAIGGQTANSTSVADGAASSAVTASGLYRIAATSASLVNIGPSVSNGANGEYWPADHVEVRYLTEGDKVGVSASA